MNKHNTTSPTNKTNNNNNKYPVWAIITSSTILYPAWAIITCSITLAALSNDILTIATIAFAVNWIIASILNKIFPQENK